MKASIYLTDISNKRYFDKTVTELPETDKKGGWGCIRIFPEAQYQED